ncbi:glycosyltransferase [Streptomyces lydicus]|uniref:glycosyltransferase n=1 Tax=Streptomyces lydicus TaxID=47763 RepID=UPI0036EFED85
MHVSLVISAHNEGPSLSRTVQSCIDVLEDMHAEIVVADDASEDGSVEDVERSFPVVRTVRSATRCGASPTKAMGADAARGDVLVFLDGHTKPEPGSLRRLIEDVASADGQAIVTPRLLSLDVDRWSNDPLQAGHGYRLDLSTFDCGWLDSSDMTAVRVGRRRLYESPSLIGCAFAISRQLYDILWGMDRDMLCWGVEDLDFGLKCWLMGNRVLHDPDATVGHRFRESFDNYEVPSEHFFANQLRMARKNFTEGTWRQWLEFMSRRHLQVSEDVPESLWARAWLTFHRRKSSVEQERAYLHARRSRDEIWYARRFGLDWPHLSEFPESALFAVQELAGSGGPRPSPSPAPSGVPTLVLLSPPRNQTFAITGDALMPTVTAEARILGVSPDPTSTTDFHWTVQITFDSSACRHGPHRTINPPAITQTTRGTPLSIVFPLVRGGLLSIQVQATVNGRLLTARSQGLSIVGTNPPAGTLHAALPHDVLRRIARHESQCKQFDAQADGGTSGCPLFSGDNLGGVGVMQLTSPPPTDDQVWSWHANIDEGIRRLSSKVTSARAYPAQVQGTQRFRDLVTTFNAARVASGKPPVQVTVPAFSSSGFAVPVGALGQVELDAIRGFNGWGGRDAFGLPLHEFRVVLDATGGLVVDIPVGSNRGSTRWERVPAAARPQTFGDPDYVAHALAATPC